MFDQKTGDCPTGDLICGFLKEGQEEVVLQLILYCLKLYPYAWGDALHKGPLLLGGILQARVFSLQVLMRHPSQGVHRVPPSLNLLPQPPCLLCFRPDKSPKVAAPCHNMKPISLK